MQAIRRQVAAMPHDLYLVRLIHSRTRRAFPGERLWTAAQLINPATIAFLRIRNREGCDVYIQPYADNQNAGYILVDLDSADLTVIDRMRNNGHDPCVVLQTSPGHLQAWIHVSNSPLEPCIATVVARQLARDYGGDLASADWRHLGRLAGFTNQKPMRRTSRDFAPWVKVVSAQRVLVPQAEAMLQSARALAAWHGPPVCGSNATLPDPVGIGASAAVEIYRGCMQRWRIRERFPQPDWSIVDLWVARHLLAQGTPATLIADILRLASPQFPRGHGDPEDYLRRTITCAAFPPGGGSVWDHHHESAPFHDTLMEQAAAKRPP
jgi:hypothetical protein